MLDIIKAGARQLQEIAQEIQKAWLSLREWIGVLKARALDLGASNRAMALEFIARGEFREAAFRLKMALRFRPDSAELWHLLGRCHQMTDRRVEAGAAFKRAIALDPKNEETRFLLALVDPGIRSELLPHTFPVSLVKEYFGATASRYDQQQGEMGYKSPDETISLVRYYLGAPDASKRIADIGCGTGLMGPLLRPYASELIGIDVCREMADIAFLVHGPRDAVIYDDMAVEDARDYLLRRIAPSFDLITASYVVNYIGGLGAVMDGTAKALKPGGWLIFTTDRYEGTGYHLNPRLQRFAHSESYIEEQGKRADFVLHTIQPVTVYEGVQSLGVVYRKPL